MSFWHNENIDVSGKLLAVTGTGLTVAQIAQEIAKEAATSVVFQVVLIYSITDLMQDSQKSTKKRRATLKFPYDGSKRSQSFNTTSSNVKHSTIPSNSAKASPKTLAKRRLRILARHLHRPALLRRRQPRSPQTLELENSRPHQRSPEMRHPSPHSNPSTPSTPNGTASNKTPTKNSNEPHINVVDLRSHPIREIVSEGIITTDGTHPMKFDIIALISH
jgi:hypothetical protein